MENAPVRLRMAPSPTGEPHIGTAYTTLFNLLLARKLGGEMILRIEDTDQARSTPESEAKLLRALHWLGFDWAEGPDKGGPYGPYRQSERKETYKGYVQELLDKGHAFECFCSKERLEEMRREQEAKGEATGYDGRCLHRPQEELDALEAKGEPFVVRMKVPSEGACTFIDGVRGEVSIPYEAVDMQVLQKADGMPTYHLANVVDDHLMKITHVARGEEWLPSTPKHVLLYEYFGWEKPAFMHLPLMRNADKSKLSKRKNPTSLSYFESVGYLPETLVNFLGLFFISIAEGDEVMDFEELSARFDPDALNKGGAVFDTQKLDWLNGQWLRERLSEERYLEAVRAWATEGGRLEKTLLSARQRIAVFGELPELCAFMFQGGVALTAEDFDGAAGSLDLSLDYLKGMMGIVESLESWEGPLIQKAIGDMAKEKGGKLRDVMPTLFLAVTGSRRSLPLFDSMETLGRSVVRARVRAAMSVLEEAGAA
jgi:glutamyl-tRNA synthetase